MAVRVTVSEARCAKLEIGGSYTEDKYVAMP
jgi:hypothetical protein